MPPKESPSARTTVYRLQNLPNLEAAIRGKYLTDERFTATPTIVGGREALLVAGTMHRDQAAWAARLATIANQPVEVGNTTAAAVLLVRDAEDTAFAMTYGMGFQLLEPATMDPGFGMRVAIRTASPDAIQSLTRTELDYRSRTDRSSIPAGESLRGFGMGDFGEVITRICGTARLSGLAVGKKDIRVRAADALSVPLGKKPSTLIADLEAISTALRRTANPELQALEQLVRVKRPDLIEELETNLRSALNGNDSARLALGWPHERIDDNGTPVSYKLTGTGNRSTGVNDDLPTLAILVNALRSKSPHDPLAAANSVKVQLFRDADGEDPVSQAIPAKYWLFYEATLKGTRYCLFDSRWYAMDTAYAQRLQDHVEKIFDRAAPVEMPDWNIDEHRDESEYNEMAASEVGGLMLDRKLLQTKQHPRGFEACDIITPNGDFIHVKHTPKSSAASHLVAQALVATNALQHDDEARKELQEIVIKAGGSKELIPTRPTSIVLGIARDKSVTPSDLFSFTQVTVTRLDTALATAGITLTIAPICVYLALKSIRPLMPDSTPELHAGICHSLLHKIPDSPFGHFRSK